MQATPKPTHTVRCQKPLFVNSPAAVAQTPGTGTFFDERDEAETTAPGPPVGPMKGEENQIDAGAC
jgi:hypothetical protein